MYNIIYSSLCTILIRFYNIINKTIKIGNKTIY